MTVPSRKTPSGATARTPAPKRCPICGAPAESAHQPFCSARCSDVDLHRWLGGAYAIPTPEAAEDQDLPAYASDEQD